MSSLSQYKLPFYGVTIGVNTNEANFPAATYADAQGLGLNCIRAQVRWTACEPVQTTPPTYTTPVYDAFVLACNAIGILPYITIEFAPSWWLTQSISGNNFPDPTGTALFGAYLANRYNGYNGNGQIAVLEIGNEDYDPNGGDVALANVLPVAAPAIRAANPGILVGCAAILRKLQSHYNTWIGTLVAQHCISYVDFMNIHYYPQGAAPAPYWPSWTSGDDISFMNAIQTMYNLTNKQIMITETNWPINVNPGHTNIVTQEQQWDNLFAELEACRISRMVSGFFPFTLAYTLTGGTYDGDSLVQPGPTYVTSYTNYAGYIAGHQSWP